MFITKYVDYKTQAIRKEKKNQAYRNSTELSLDYFITVIVSILYTAKTKQKQQKIKKLVLIVN